MNTDYPPINHLALARRHADAYEERLYCDDFPGTDAERQEWQSQPYTLALVNAAIAQVEAGRPHFIRIGGYFINIAQIAYVDFEGQNLDGERVLKVGFAATSHETYMELWFRRAEYEPAARVLRQALNPMLVAEADVPAKPVLECAPAGYDPL